MLCCILSDSRRRVCTAVIAKFLQREAFCNHLFDTSDGSKTKTAFLPFSAFSFRCLEAAASWYITLILHSCPDGTAIRQHFNVESFYSQIFIFALSLQSNKLHWYSYWIDLMLTTFLQKSDPAWRHRKEQREQNNKPHPSHESARQAEKVAVSFSRLWGPFPCDASEAKKKK